MKITMGKLKNETKNNSGPVPKFLKRTLLLSEAHRRNFDCDNYNDCLTAAAKAGQGCLSFVCDDCIAYAKNPASVTIPERYLEYFEVALRLAS